MNGPFVPPDLLAEVKRVLRVTSAAFDGEVGMLAGAAVADMVRAGVSEACVCAMGPLVRQAVCLYCKANFGFDNEEAARLQGSYRQTVVDLLNSDANEAAR